MELYIVMVGTLPLMLAVVAFSVWVWTHIVTTRRNLDEFKPDSNGNYAVVRYNGHFHQFAPGNAPQPPALSHVTYSPHTVYHNRGQASATVVDAEPVTRDLPAPKVPTFAELLEHGEVGKNKPIILGYDALTQPIKGSWLDLYSGIVAGVSGSGKTTTTRFLVAQAALGGARFILIDPHMGNDEDSLATTLDPLSGLYLCQPAAEDDEILSVVNLTSEELEKRKRNKYKGYPLIVAIDELTSLMRGNAAKPIAGLLQDIAQEGRKFNIFALTMGQIFKGSTSGGTEVRDSFASAYVHRLKPNQARLLLPSDEANIAARLDTGKALFCDTRGNIQPVSIPLTTGYDVATVAGLLANDRLPEEAAEVASSMPDVSQMLASSEQATNPLQRGKVISAEAVRVASLFREGKDLAEIVKEVKGVSSNQGRNYQTALKEVQQLLREGLA